MLIKHELGADGRTVHGTKPPLGEVLKEITDLLRRGATAEYPGPLLTDRLDVTLRGKTVRYLAAYSSGITPDHLVAMLRFLIVLTHPETAGTSTLERCIEGWVTGSNAHQAMLYMKETADALRATHDMFDLRRQALVMATLAGVFLEPRHIAAIGTDRVLEAAISELNRQGSPRAGYRRFDDIVPYGTIRR